VPRVKARPLGTTLPRARVYKSLRPAGGNRLISIQCRPSINPVDCTAMNTAPVSLYVRSMFPFPFLRKRDHERETGCRSVEDARLDDLHLFAVNILSHLFMQKIPLRISCNILAHTYAQAYAIYRIPLAKKGRAAGIDERKIKACARKDSRSRPVFSVLSRT
jgi:hypothetical protein